MCVCEWMFIVGMLVDVCVCEGYFFGCVCVCVLFMSWWCDDVECVVCDVVDVCWCVLVLLNMFMKIKVLFKLLSGNLVGWYICGSTVYDSAYVGYVCNYVNFDVLRRVMMEYFGYDVWFVMNVMDIDDKIIMCVYMRWVEVVVKVVRETGETRFGAETLAVEKLLVEGGKLLGVFDSVMWMLVNVVKVVIGSGIDVEYCCVKDWMI